MTIATRGPAPSARRVATTAEARGLVEETLDALGALDETLARETEGMRIGRINEALTLVAIKQERSGAYMRLLESVKANAVALARLAPDGIETLKARHAAFLERLKLNQTVIATVRSVSESLVRGLQQETTATRTLSVYGPGASTASRAPMSAPLALSVRL